MENLANVSVSNPKMPEPSVPNPTVAEEVEMNALCFDPNPADPGSPTNKNVLTYGVDPDGNKVPPKTLRITNNTAGTVYPILRDPNSSILKSDPAVGLYDPYDPPNKEYRGYIGYKENDKYYFGLKAGESILISIPLVFWNGARIGIGTDNKYLVVSKKGQLPNPLTYDPDSNRTIAPAEKSDGTIPNGVVMWYRAETPQAPNDDTEDQLAEWTIRDHDYLSNSKIQAKTNNEIPDNQLVTLINYDVSNVDNLYLPLAMEALDVWVVPQITGEEGNLTQWTPGSIPDIYGWTGAIKTTQELQKHISDFTAPNNNLLGQYFSSEGHGWPFYNIPNPNNDPSRPIKIPSGANIFAQSPIRNTLSSYADGKYMLSSGGTGPVQISIGAGPFKINIGGEGSASTGNILTLNSLEKNIKEKANSLQKGMSVKCYAPQGKPNPIQLGTKILDVYVSTSPPLYTIKLDNDLAASQDGCNFDFFWSFEDANKTLMFSPVDPVTADLVSNLCVGMSVVGRPNQGVKNPIKGGSTIERIQKSTGPLDPHKIQLNQDLDSSQDGCSFDFVRPVTDYASNAMIRLWYSWAEYYRAHWGDKNTHAPTASVTITGSMDLRTATLSFGESHPELVKGMAVTGLGLDDAKTEDGTHQGNAVILKIASDNMSVILSQVANQSSSQTPFTFYPPQELLHTPKSLTDPGYPLYELTFANEQLHLPACRDPYEFAQKVYMIMASMNQIGQPNNGNVCKFMQDIVGANMGYIFDQLAKDSDDGKMLQAMIRDMIKSVLRGVVDFTVYPDDVDEQGNHTQWYPDPKEHHGGQPFNVFNLDPFVWFVHTILGFSGYGFSVDDDTADIGAGGANHLQITVGDEGGLQKTIPWTIQAPFGPVEKIPCRYSGAKKGDTLYYDIQSVIPTKPIKIITKEPHNLSKGDTVIIEQVKGVKEANGTFKIGNVTKDTFDLYDDSGINPIAGTGTYDPSQTPTWSYPLHPYIDTVAPHVPSTDPTDLAKVFYRVTGDDSLGTFQGTFVSADNLAKTANGEKFRVWRLGKQEYGRLLLNTALLDDQGNDLPAGDYSFTFFGPKQLP